MSIELDDVSLAESVRNILKKKKVSLKQLSEYLSVPYRTVQNYLAGDQKIPAIFLLRICHYVGLEPSYFIYGDFRLNQNDMYDAVYEVLDRLNLLPAHEIQNLNEGGQLISSVERNQMVSSIAVQLIERYDHWSAKRIEGGICPGSLVPFGKRSLRDK